MMVVNIKSYGGVDQAREAGVKYLGRPSPLGNPCSIPNVPCPICGVLHFATAMEQKTACRSVPCYRKWLWGEIQARNPRILDALAELHEEDEVGCWCSPKACHADVVVKAWKYCKEQGLI